MAGRPLSPRSIVQSNEVHLPDMLLQQRWSLMELLPQLSTTWNCLQWLARHGLIRNSVTCPNCHILCVITQQTRQKDGYRWLCGGCRRFSQGVRSGSFFENSRLTLKHLIQISYFWSWQFPSWLIYEELRLSKKIIVEWMKFHREVCSQWLAANPPFLGGLIQQSDGTIEGVCVEIDETLLRRRKYHRGRWIP